MTTQAPPSVGVPHRNLPARLDALAELVRIGRARGGQGGFSPKLLGDADALLRRAGERLRLSGSHTVVALAGGTGSGKSTLFNALSGAAFSQPGVTRPTTRHVHACVWGMQGAAPLLDWLGVQRRHRYARASALDAGEASLTGMLLLDLPDHDSVVSASMAAVDRLSTLADMLIWVLDPQKYADAAVHSRYLIPLAGHARVITVVLNQIDLLTPEQVSDCESDLRRLLDSEGLSEAQLLPVSARTGAGLDELRAVLTEAVAARSSSSERIAADVDAVLAGFGEHNGPSAMPVRDEVLAVSRPDDEPSAGARAGRAAAVTGAEPVPGEPREAPAVGRPPWEDATPDGYHDDEDDEDPVACIPGESAAELTGALARAAGLTAVTDAMVGVREARAARYIGWPLGRLIRSRRHKVRGLRAAAGGGRSIAATAGRAQQSDIDNAINGFADQVSGQLPQPWSRTVRDAARSGSDEAREALAEAVRESIPPQDKVTGWWRLILVLQWLLMLVAVAGVAWIAVIAAHGGHRSGSVLISDSSLIPWLAVMVVAILLLGWLTASGCQNLVLLAADRERDAAEEKMRSRVSGVARDLVLAPAGREIAEYERFRHELSIAGGT